MISSDYSVDSNGRLYVDNMHPVVMVEIQLVTLVTVIIGTLCESCGAQGSNIRAVLYKLTVLAGTLSSKGSKLKLTLVTSEW